MTKGINFYRGFIARAENGYGLPSTSSNIDLHAIYLRRLRGEDVDIHRPSSPYIDQILWGSGDKQAPVAISIVFSRYLARLALDKKFREDITKDAKTAVPAMGISRVDPHDAYVFLETGITEIHPYLNMPTRADYGHLIVQKIDPATTQVHLVDPKERERLHRLLSLEDSEVSEMLMENILPTVGYARISDFNEVAPYVYRNPQTGRNRSLFEVLNIGLTLSLEKMAANRGNQIAPGELIDTATRVLSAFFHSVVHNKKVKDEFTIAPDNIDQETYQPFLQPDIDPEILERQEFALNRLKEMAEASREITGSKPEQRS